MASARHTRHGRAAASNSWTGALRSRAVRRLGVVVTIVMVVVSHGATEAPAKVRGADGLIAYSSFDAATDDAHIFVSNPDGTGVRELDVPVSGVRPGWSPDGSRLLVSERAPTCTAAAGRRAGRDLPARWSISPATTPTTGCTRSALPTAVVPSG